MSQALQTFSVDAFDAVSIQAYGCRIAILGSEITSQGADQVVLESEHENPTIRGFHAQIKGRWLQIVLWAEHDYDEQLTLRLPRRKAWTIDASAGWGKATIAGLDARLRFTMGKGDLKVNNCRGQFTLTSGEGNLTLERFSDLPIPDAPPVPEFDAFQSEPGEKDNAFPFEDFSDWSNWGPEEWSRKGWQFGQRAMNWGIRFGQMFTTFGRTMADAAIFISVGKGDVAVEQIVVGRCSVSMGKGNFKLRGGTIHDLTMSTSHGDFDCSSVLPGGDWKIKTNHGNLRLALPADTNARIDAATRSGDIRSDIPLVRVPRPGPENDRSVRMVGTIGTSGEATAQIALAAIHAHMKIELQRENSGYSAAQGTMAPSAAGEPASQPSVARGSVDVVTPVDIAAPDATTPESAAVESPAPAAAPAQVIYVPAAEHREPSGHSGQMAILEALSEGTISVEEAEILLGNL